MFVAGSFPRAETGVNGDGRGPELHGRARRGEDLRTRLMYLSELGGLTTPRPTSITRFSGRPTCNTQLATKVTEKAQHALPSTCVFELGDGTTLRAHLMYLSELGGSTTPPPAPTTRSAGSSACRTQLAKGVAGAACGLESDGCCGPNCSEL